MKADFGTLAAVFGFITNSAGILALWSVLQRDEIKEVKSALSSGIETKLANYGFISRQRKKLRSELFSIWLILLNLFNIIILLSLLLILILGPERIFSPQTAGAVAEPLLLWERVLYTVWFISCTLAYIIRGFMPTLQLWKLYTDSGKWLSENEPKQRPT